MNPDTVAANVVRGQYGPGWVAAGQVGGYRSEAQVDPGSETETYVAARLFVDDWRWAGVPFYLRAGKRLPKRATEIAIQFKQVPHALFKDSSVDPEANLLALRLRVQRGQPGRLRDADPRRAPGRRLALHASRRGGEGLGARQPDHRRVGRRAGARVPELCRGELGPRRFRCAARAGRATVAADLREPVDGRPGGAVAPPAIAVVPGDPELPRAD